MTTEVKVGNSLPSEMLGKRLWPRGARLNMWAVLDCARDPQLWWMLDRSSLARECLYAGSLSPQLERAAPYLVQLEFEDAQTMKLLDRGWGNSWGILLRANTNLKALRNHLRRLLMVRGPGEKVLVFRYYDPRVMRVFLPTCAPTQLMEMFGPIESIFTEERDPRRMTEFRFDPEMKVMDSKLIELD